DRRKTCSAAVLGDEKAELKGLGLNVEHTCIGRSRERQARGVDLQSESVDVGGVESARGADRLAEDQLAVHTEGARTAGKRSEGTGIDAAQNAGGRNVVAGAVGEANGAGKVRVHFHAGARFTESPV